MTGRKLNALQIEECVLQPGEDWIDAQGAWRLVRLHSGAAYWIGSEHYELAAGDALALGPGAEGAIRASQIGPATLHSFCFAPDLLWGIFTIAERRFFEAEAIGKRNAMVQHAPANDPLARKFEELVASRTRRSPLTQRLRALELVAEIFDEQLAQSSAPPTRGSTGKVRFGRLLSAVVDNDLVNHGAEELARMCGCSQRHFNRLFHEEFGMSLRERQTDLRILKAKALLLSTDDKVIEVAHLCGYRSLGLFNTIFKKKLNMTPSEWRKRAAKKATRIIPALALIGLLSSSKAAETNAPAIAPKKAQTFEVKRYEVSGNTLLNETVTEPILTKHLGPAIAFDEIRQTLVDLQTAYRQRGFVTVAVGLPPQQITNGTVRIQVTEGKLGDIRVTNNRYFSSNNVMRDFPRLQTNAMLNSYEFQPQLDRANANRDRQIYPIMSPGAEPGTTDLELKVKDRLPLHARTEFNNNSTPNSPELRLDTSVQYNNLWQLNHQLGAQYSFSPEKYKQGDFPPYDQPLIANYSAFYRMPIPGLDDGNTDKDSGSGNFGYDEATHRFHAPPLQRTTEAIVYASRSSSDTGPMLQSQTLTPTVIPAAGALQLKDEVLARTLNPTENLGFRLMRQLPDFAQIESTASFGLDYKFYRARTKQTRRFQATLYVPEIGASGPPFTTFESPPTFTSQQLYTHVEYLPISLAWNGSRKDKSGITSFDFSLSFQPANILDSETDFQNASLDSKATGQFVIINSGLTRDQTIWNGYGIKFHADGQWANQPLLSTEQYALGGLSGVRGYHEGQVYGDRGWRLSVEPHSPYINMGMIDARIPLVARAFLFFDAGQRYLIGNGLTISLNTQEKVSTLASAGFGVSFTAGSHFEGRFQIGFPFFDSPAQPPFNNHNIEGGQPRAAFGFAFVF